MPPSQPLFRVAGTRFYLVESDGELFVVSGPVYDSRPIIYQVDTQNRVLQPVRCIGSHALFVADNRCICIDSSMVPTVQASNIYYPDLSYISSYNYEALAWEEEPRVVHG